MTIRSGHAQSSAASVVRALVLVAFVMIGGAAVAAGDGDFWRSSLEDPTCTCVRAVPIYVVAPVGGWFQSGCGRDVSLIDSKGVQANYGLLEFPDCLKGECVGTGVNSEAKLECLLANGSTCPMMVLYLATAPGAHTGAVRSAIEYRFAQDVDSREGICFADYRGNGGRVVVLPVTLAPGAGRSTVRVIGYGQFFLKNIPGHGADDALHGEFIRSAVP